MKKLFTKIWNRIPMLFTKLLVGLSMMPFSMIPIVNAQTTQQVPTDSGPTVDQLFNTGSYTSGNGNSKIGIVANLKANSSSDWLTLISATIKFILSIAGVLALISFTVAGIMMVSARGNEEQIKKGKGILVWSILALAIIAASYAIVLGITQLQFSQ